MRPALRSSTHLKDLTTAVKASVSGNPLHTLAIRHKLAGIFDGYLARDGLWEKLFWKQARAQPLGGLVAGLRSVVVVNSSFRASFHPARG